ncbi:hypothetical protein BU23DRAFT_221249 [Bimuria novae-zelandiae CBS 107.79]|uniref:Uncharacterized protein n=1 Tax=Bimuria novae-zelandiae CBS 107.79 TaxID=1447943 RepID=A0A6A5VLW9_9PLEO|nr:hypothetical protein BU23DRAFT_221249 [Bimuria novae-zelandiae CBS 107.79]
MLQVLPFLPGFCYQQSRSSFGARNFVPQSAVVESRSEINHWTPAHNQLSMLLRTPAELTHADIKIIVTELLFQKLIQVILTQPVRFESIPGPWHLDQAVAVGAPACAVLAAGFVCRWIWPAGVRRAGFMRADFLWRQAPVDEAATSIVFGLELSCVAA